MTTVGRVGEKLLDAVRIEMGDFVEAKVGRAFGIVLNFVGFVVGYFLNEGLEVSFDDGKFAEGVKVGS